MNYAGLKEFFGSLLLPIYKTVACSDQSFHNLLCILSVACFTSTKFFSLFSFQGTLPVKTGYKLLIPQALVSILDHKLFEVVGGPKWTRTTDLTIISRAL